MSVFIFIIIPKIDNHHLQLIIYDENKVYAQILLIKFDNK